MRTLLLLRHAKASRADEGVPDHDRPLSERGRRSAERVGHLLADLNLRPDTIISSTSQRTQETAELVAEVGGLLQAVEYDERLYLASDKSIIRILSRVPARAQCVMIVGHNPGLEDLFRSLTGHREELPTAALAGIDLNIESWSELTPSSRGSLKGVWRPRDLVAD